MFSALSKNVMVNVEKGTKQFYTHNSAERKLQDLALMHKLVSNEQKCAITDRSIHIRIYAMCYIIE